MAVSVDQEGWNVVRPYIDGLKPNYPVFVADESITREFGGINTLPTTYFVHRNGTIHAKHVGELSRSHMIQDIEALLRAGIGPESDESGKEGGAPSDGGTESITSSTGVAPGSLDVTLSKRTVEAGSGAFHGIVPPEILKRVVPDLPEGFGATIPEGFVELEARIGEDGNAYDDSGRAEPASRLGRARCRSPEAVAFLARNEGREASPVQNETSSSVQQERSSVGARQTPKCSKQCRSRPSSKRYTVQVELAVATEVRSGATPRRRAKPRWLSPAVG